MIRRYMTGSTDPITEYVELAADYGVAHTSLSRYFRRADVVAQLKRAELLRRAEERADEARFRDELRVPEAR